MQEEKLARTAPLPSHDVRHCRLTTGCCSAAKLPGRKQIRAVLQWQEACGTHPRSCTALSTPAVHKSCCLVFGERYLGHAFPFPGSSQRFCEGQGCCEFGRAPLACACNDSLSDLSLPLRHLRCKPESALRPAANCRDRTLPPTQP